MPALLLVQAAPSNAFARVRTKIWLCSLVAVHSTACHSLGEGCPNIVGMAETPRRWQLRAGRDESLKQQSNVAPCTYTDMWLMFSSAFSWSKAGTTFS